VVFMKPAVSAAAPRSHLHLNAQGSRNVLGHDGTARRTRSRALIAWISTSRCSNWLSSNSSSSLSDPFFDRFSKSLKRSSDCGEGRYVISSSRVGREASKSATSSPSHFAERFLAMRHVPFLQPGPLACPAQPGLPTAERNYTLGGFSSTTTPCIPAARPESA